MTWGLQRAGSILLVYGLIALRLTGAASGMLVSLVLARADPVAFNTYSVVVIVSVITGTVAGGGLDCLIVRDFSTRLKDRMPDQLRISRTVFLIVAGLSFPAALLNKSIAHYVCPVTLSTPLSYLLVAAQAWSLPLVAFLRGHQRFVSAQCVEAFNVQFATLALLLIQRHDGFLDPIDCFAAASAFNLAFGLLCAVRIVWRTRRDACLWRGGLGLPPSWIAEAPQFLGISMLFIIQGRLDQLFASRLFTPVSFGAYRIASQLYEFSSILSATSLATLQPKLAAAVYEDDRPRIKELLVVPIRANFAAMLLALVLIGVAGKTVLSLLFPQYALLTPLIVVLLSFRLLSMIFPASGSLLDVSGHQRISLAALALNVLCIMALAYPAAVYFGPIGSAVLSGSLLLLRHVYLLLACRRVLGVSVTVMG